MGNKRYFWLKLKEDFFEDDTIQWLEEQENGKEYTLFYLKLCLKSLKNDGVLTRYVGDYIMPYDKKALSKLTNTDADTVEVAMRLFKQIGLVEIFETGEIYMKQISEMVGSETNKAVLMRRKRAEDKQKEVEGNKRVTLCQNVTQSKSKSKSKSESKSETEEDRNSINVHRFYQENFGVESSFIAEDLEYWIKDLSEELVLLALQKSVKNQRNYSYAEGIMKNWVKKNIDTVEKAEAESMEFNNRNRSFMKNSSGRDESLPDWAKDGYESEEDEKVSPEEEKRIRDRLKNRKKGKNEG